MKYRVLEEDEGVCEPDIWFYVQYFHVKKNLFSKKTGWYYLVKCEYGFKHNVYYRKKEKAEEHIRRLIKPILSKVVAEFEG